MKIADTGLLESTTRYLESRGYARLYPPQADSIKAGLLKGRSVIVSAPTASGKTLIAMMAMLGHLESRRRSIIYLSPLRALAAEKYSEFKEIESIPGMEGVRVRISTGDYDATERPLEPGDIIIMTNEKADAAIRHSPCWADGVGLIIADEIHLLGDPYRGAVLEMILSRFRRMNDTQIVGLSATISNGSEIARWLNADLVSSQWRPVPLSEGIYSDGRLSWHTHGASFDSMGRRKKGRRDADREILQVTGDPSIDLAIDSVREGGQSIIFAQTRRSAASFAVKSSRIIGKAKLEYDADHLKEVSRDILTQNENTRMVLKLAELVGKGAAFHHAGLSSHCREVVEREFRSGNIKVLSATPTLAAGVNMPARRVIISSLTRYDAIEGSTCISVMEYKQLAGRAGRPQYDDHGEAVLIENSRMCDLSMYVGMEPEPVESQIVSRDALSVHVLSLIVTTARITEEDIITFFEETLGGMQQAGIMDAEAGFGAGYEDPVLRGAEHNMQYRQAYAVRMRDRVTATLEFLEKDDFIRRNGATYAATRFGRAVSLLYIRPETATTFRRSFGEFAPELRHSLSILDLITVCNEFIPKPKMRRDDYDLYDTILSEHPEEDTETMALRYHNRGFLALYYWIAEATDSTISDLVGVESGDMHRMTESAAWLVHSMSVIARLCGFAELAAECDILHRRIRHGIREELAELVLLKGIGRVRARSLFKHGIKGLGDLASAPVKDLARIEKIGRQVAEEIKAQLATHRPEEMTQ